MFRILIVLGVVLIAVALAIAIRSSTFDGSPAITPPPADNRGLDPRAPQWTPTARAIVDSSLTRERRQDDPSTSEGGMLRRGDPDLAADQTPVGSGQLFDLAGLQDALATGSVPIDGDASRPLEPGMASRLIEATRSGFDAFLQIYDNRQEVETSTTDARDKLEEVIDFAELLAAILPESRALFLSKRIAIEVDFSATTAQTMLFSLDQPGGDLTVNILGHDTRIRLVIPHDVGPRSLWRRIYQRIERRGQLPRRFRPSSIGGAGTLSLEALQRGN